MNKSIFSNNNGDIHFGLLPADGFNEANEEDVKKALANLGDRKFWRCTVCNDLHIGDPPDVCPTCSAIEAYVEISEQEFKTIIGI